MPALCGRSSWLRGRRVANFRPWPNREIRSPSPRSRSITLPRLRRRSSSRRVAPLAPYRERTRVEAPHDPAPDAEDDDHADPQPHPHVTHAERARRQERKRRVVSGGRPPGRNGADVEDALRAGSDPDPLRIHPKPLHAVASRPHPRLPAQRAGEAGPRDVDEQGAPSGVPDDDRPGRRAPQRQAERACAERDAAAGRGTRDGCRGRSEDERQKGRPHLPITVNVSVAV